MFPKDIKYAVTHEWARVKDNVVEIGITKHAIDALTDLTYFEFILEEGDEVTKGDIFGEVESVKTSSSLYCPVSGTIVEVNQDIADNLETLMEDPYGAGWLIKIEMSDPEELDAMMDAAGYKAHAESESH
ncbi:MAG TPA: glycine cleavage system protein GcvH [Planctomycetota bacterium]|nr:glycine cleavage system protein GcvH [Planctomycetota bacterium]HQB00292.1 glycine cleavage system protein GcvH [Planctomycetota bacterium]HRU52557.1 glycine cleavage system protein GcvH [Planctomycetota bacterium]